MAAEIGASRVGLRISPAHGVQDVLEPDAADVETTYGLLVDALAPLGLAYLSVLHADPTSDLVQGLRARFGGHLMINDGFGVVTSREAAESLVAQGTADSVAVGRMVIANPDLVERWDGGHPENAPDPDTFYAGGAARLHRLPVPLGRLSGRRTRSTRPRSPSLTGGRPGSRRLPGSSATAFSQAMPSLSRSLLTFFLYVALSTVKSSTEPPLSTAPFLPTPCA